ncbi:hypothetical protein [Nitrospirillum viridazoti]|uniref:Uncharacterized protein n=1 Tax=Nitrospirillum viridazoti CBAmc TaxID=1441467 RepID=A0A248JWK5_9PROT|nr:hypothetical protein [Nitrospirillum amazonense]ASG23085.1 hypothetical protein Y958_19710 [Nitrospirillum amazonense CBAmc]TWB38818.1 hypothetical protein FBZ91_106146 [Nitrospirillum amazonense]
MARIIVIERGPGGLWAAHDSAGLIGGVFTERRAAVTFATFQPDHPTVLLRAGGAGPAGAKGRAAAAPFPSTRF